MLGEILEFAVGAGLQAARIKQLKETFIAPAVVIAQSQGWVSFGRLSNQLGLTRKDAQIVLFGACQQGLLYQAVNGRFYPATASAPAALGLPHALIEEAEGEVVPPPASARSSSSGTGFGILAFIGLVGLIIAAILIAGQSQSPVQVVSTADLPSVVTPVAAPSPVPTPLSEPWQAPLEAIPVPDPTAPGKKRHKHAKHKANE